MRQATCVTDGETPCIQKIDCRQIGSCIVCTKIPDVVLLDTVLDADAFYLFSLYFGCLVAFKNLQRVGEGRRRVRVAYEVA